ncbi:MAG: FAD-dependent monooxygenase [Nevskiaceae bacterium]|nr:FAD-dependent monooxygenase [Nevskiaceae bacterium]
MDQRLSVAIVGGGIGGLAAANAMMRRGLKVTVFEQAPELGEVGAGVMLTPNCIRLLQRMDLGAEIDRLGARITEGSSYRRRDGSVVGPIKTSDTAGQCGVYGMHRADLLTMLANRLPRDAVRTNHCCVGFSQDAQAARLSFANGETFEADVVIAADGIHSRLQREVVEPARPVFSGMVAYRGLVPADRLPQWRRDVHLIWMGEGKHFMVFPVRSGQLLNFVGFLPSDYAAEESWSGLGDAAALAQSFTGWEAPVEQILAKVEKPFWWGLFDREPLDHWTRGRLALLGDAAHAMLPHLGQGANQSVEDAVALAAMLARAQRSDVAQALVAYEQMRRPRAVKVQLGARANGRRYDSQYDDLAQRDAEIADAGTLRAWLYDYDVEKELGC